MIITHKESKILTTLLERVDADADAARIRVMGDATKTKEYEIAEKEATAFKAAGYQGKVPRSVQAWADAKGWTASKATDDILAAATRATDMLMKIRNARLKAKEAIKNGNTAEGIHNIYQDYEVLMWSIS